MTEGIRSGRDAIDSEIGDSASANTVGKGINAHHQNVTVEMGRGERDYWNEVNSIVFGNPALGIPKLADELRSIHNEIRKLRQSDMRQTESIKELRGSIEALIASGKMTGYHRSRWEMVIPVLWVLGGIIMLVAAILQLI